jgi:hypothetical protein
MNTTTPSDLPYDLDAHDPRPKADAGVEMQLLDACRRPIGIMLRLRGTDATIYHELMGRHLVRRSERLRLSAEEQLASSDGEFYELRATLVAGWPAGAFKRNGNAFDYSPANAQELLRQYPYILEQVLAFASERRNFLP